MGPFLDKLDDSQIDMLYTGIVDDGYDQMEKYRDTVELTAYVRPDSHQRGYGSIIVRDLIERARSLSYHTILAASCEESVGMIRLLKSLGFAEAGCLRQVGSKFGRRLDVVYLQLLF